MLKFKEFVWQTEIQFDEVEVIEGVPRLYVTPHGKFPSMTSLLSILDDGGLEEWKKRVGEKEAERICEEASKRGNDLHDFNEKYLKNELKRSDLHGQGKILFNRVKRHLDTIELVVATEVPLWSEIYEYAGRVDCICMMDGQITILDHKNTRKNINTALPWNRKKIFKYLLQLYGYKRCLQELKKIKATQGCLIVGNHQSSNSDVFKFDLENKFIEYEFNKLVSIYYGKIPKEESAFFDDEVLSLQLSKCQRTITP